MKLTQAQVKTIIGIVFGAILAVIGIGLAHIVRHFISVIFHFSPSALDFGFLCGWLGCYLFYRGIAMYEKSYNRKHFLHRSN